MKTLSMVVLALSLIFPSTTLAFTVEEGEYVYLKKQFIDARTSPRKHIWLTFVVFVASPIIEKDHNIIYNLKISSAEVTVSFLNELVNI